MKSPKRYSAVPSRSTLEPTLIALGSALLAVLVAQAVLTISAAIPDAASLYPCENSSSVSKDFAVSSQGR